MASADQIAEPAEVESPVLVLRLLKHAGIQPFSDSLGLARLALPEDDPKGVLLKSPNFRSGLAAWFYERTERVLRGGEIDQIVNVLEGQARKNRVSLADPTTVWQAIESDAVCHVIAVFVAARDHRPYEGTMTTLMLQLDQLVSRGVMKGWPNLLPRSAASLSAKLHEKSDLLRAAGIGIDWSRTKAERTVRLFAIANSFSGDAAAGQLVPNPPPDDGEERHPSPSPSPLGVRQYADPARDDDDDARDPDIDVLIRIQQIGDATG